MLWVGGRGNVDTKGRPEAGVRNCSMTPFMGDLADEERARVRRNFGVVGGGKGSGEYFAEQLSRECGDGHGGLMRRAASSRTRLHACWLSEIASDDQTRSYDDIILGQARATSSEAIFSRALPVILSSLRVHVIQARHSTPSSGFQLQLHIPSSTSSVQLSSHPTFLLVVASILRVLSLTTGRSTCLWHRPTCLSPCTRFLIKLNLRNWR